MERHSIAAKIASQIQIRSALQRRLATVDRLLKFGVQIDQQCAFCKLAGETFDHLFFECYVTKEVWSRLLIWLGHCRPIQDWQREVEWISHYSTRKSGQWEIVTCVFGMMVYTIWRDRNKVRFQGGAVNVNSICREITIHIHTRGQEIQHWQGALSTLNRYP
uniref:Uncharacterized protein LOC104216321 n=1 Tax=Nicotiana sylvestris TaxID=4096 RepID=A0A1U7V9B9_NICSY|nr:PREDICTED: uncharacterized protein LOC104216321 [Nicotiana sylvestris]